MDVSGTAKASMTEDERAEAQTAKELALSKAEKLGADGTAVGAVFNSKGVGFPLEGEAVEALKRFAS